MKRICILLLVLSLGFLTLCQTSFAVTIGQDESLWVQLDRDPATAPPDFDGMTLFWGLEPWVSGAGLQINLYGPPGYSDVPSTSSEAPAIVDLNILRGEDVVFQFLNTGSQDITFTNSVAVNDESIGGIKDHPSDPSDPSKGFEFYYAFYDNATSGWGSRTVLEYIPGEYSRSDPFSGSPPGKLYSDGLMNVVNGENTPGLNNVLNIRSDFQAAPVPEPATILLLASGIAALAGGRRKFIKKRTLFRAKRK